MALLPGSDSFQCPKCGNTGSFSFKQENRITVRKVFSLNTLESVENKLYYVCVRCSEALDPNKQYKDNTTLPETIKKPRTKAIPTDNQM